MKRLCKILAVVLAAVLLTGCVEKKSKTASDPPVVLGFSQVGTESAWRKANTQSIYSAAKANGRIELKFSDAQQKKENQVSTIRNFIRQRVDVIGFSPVVETGWETLLQEAKNAGIPVILVDGKISGLNIDSLYSAWIGADFEKEGIKAANWLYSYLQAMGVDKQPIRIAHLQGVTGAAAQVGRTKGLETGIAQHSDWNIVCRQSGSFTRAKGKEVMKLFLQSNPELNVLFAENDEMALGAIQAIEEAGKAPGKDIIVVSFDATRAALESIGDGKLNCSVECNPLSGRLVAQAACDLADGKKIDRIMYVEEDLFDKNGLGGAQKAEDAIDNRKY